MDSQFQLCKTLVVHWRFGKEHGEPDIFQVNSPQVIAQHLNRKLEQFRTTPADEWHWWQVDEDLIVERAATCILRPDFFAPTHSSCYTYPR